MSPNVEEPPLNTSAFGGRYLGGHRQAPTLPEEEATPLRRLKCSYAPTGAADGGPTRGARSKGCSPAASVWLSQRKSRPPQARSRRRRRDREVRDAEIDRHALLCSPVRQDDFLDASTPAWPAGEAEFLLLAARAKRVKISVGMIPASG